jgi:hypothetical protein
MISNGYSNIVTTRYTPLQNTLTEDVIQLADAIASNNQRKLELLSRSYTDKEIATARFNWTTKDNNTTYENVNLFFVACRSGNVEFAKRLLATKEISIDEKYGSLQQTALMTATAHIKVDIIKLLLDSGADWKLTDPTKFRADHILLASCKNQEDINTCVEIISLFIDKARQTSETHILNDGIKNITMIDNHMLSIKYTDDFNSFIITRKKKFDNLESVSLNETTRIIYAISNNNDINNYIAQEKNITLIKMMPFLANIKKHKPELFSVISDQNTTIIYNLLSNMYSTTIINAANKNEPSQELLNFIFL